jgi:excinuclease UvrABC helicase subunit UvrB
LPDNQILGNILTIAVVIAVGWAYLRRENVTVWKSVAEGLEKKVELLVEQNRLLTAENAELRAKPDMEMVSGLLVRHGVFLDGIEQRLVSHEQVFDARHILIMNSLEGVTAALGILTHSRDPGSRGRRDDAV